MALTISATPNNIDSSGKYTITTDLLEDSTHVNLRIRADVIIDTVIIATVEKPKGLTVFDFTAILRANVTGITYARNQVALYFVSGGSPLVEYTVDLTETWEDGTTGITTTGANTTTTAVKFVPARGDGVTEFSDFVLTDASSRFANETLTSGATKFYFYNAVEMWLMFFTEVTDLQLFYSKDGGSWDADTTFTAAGWGAIVLNEYRLMDGVTSNLRIQIGEEGGAKISEIITIYVDPLQIEKRVVLEYDGIFGGKEYLAFEGGKVESFSTTRSYYLGPAKNRKPLAFDGVNRMQIENRYNDIYNSVYLKGLLISENVKLMLPFYTDPVGATVITEDVKTGDHELFVNKLEIEYEYPIGNPIILPS